MLDMTGPNERAVIGNNEPPEDSKLDTWKIHAEELRVRSVGIVITNDEQAEKVAELVDDAKTALKDVGATITEERRPHTNAANAVTQSYKPVQTSLEAVRDAAVKVAGDWRKAQEAKRDKEAAEARRVAAEKEAEAAKLAESADVTEAEDIAKLREAEDAAKVAKMDANKARTRKVSSGGTRMMSRHSVTVSNRRELLFHVATLDPESLQAWLEQWADTAVKNGAEEIPGVEIKRWKEAV